MKNWIVPIVSICFLPQILSSTISQYGSNETIKENHILILVDGCTDPLACNFDAGATIEDGSCDYGIPTCVDPCSSFVGCTDAMACNFQYGAVCDDGSCYYNTSSCPDDPCNNDLNCVASNPREIDVKIIAVNAGCGVDLYCTKIEVRGQGGADYLGGSSIRFNYDPAVLCFDRYTEFNQSNQTNEQLGSVGTYNSINFDDDQTSLSSGCNLFNATPYSPHSFDGQIPGCFLLTIFLDLETIQTPTEDIVFACPSIQDTWTEFAEICFEVKDPNGNPNFQFTGVQNDLPASIGTQFNDDFNDPVSKYWNGTLSGLTTTFNEVCSTMVMGCTDSIACNYDLNATIEDGSCIYETACDVDICTNGGAYVWNTASCECVLQTATVPGCTDPTVCNYDPVANCLDASCIFEIPCNTNPCIEGGTQVWDSASCSCVLQTATVFGCSDATACNYNESANCDDLSCIYESNCDTDICTNGGSYVWSNVSCNCELSEATVFGCTDVLAANYDSLANCNDGFCEVNAGCQLSIEMPYAGWHLISSYCKPLNDSIEAVFRPIISDIIQVKNLTGQVYIPSFNNFNNGLDFWDIKAGYFVKTFSSSTLNIRGEETVDLSIDNIPLYSGWNLIAYWLQGDSDPVEVFDDLVSDVIQVKNLVGAFVPSFNNFNNMGNMVETSGYLVKMNVAGTLSYDAANVLPTPTPGGDIDRLKPVHFAQEIKPNPNTSTMIVLDDEKNNLSYGDELGIFTNDDLLVGAFVYENDLMGGLIFGDDETEDGVDGILENENYVFKVWNKELNTERSVEMEFVKGNSSYNKNDLCVIEFKNNIGINAIDGLSISVNPNPVSSQVTFDIDLLESENFTIEIYNVDGKLVEVIFDGKLATGNSKVDYNVDHLSSGLYIYKISNRKEYMTERLTITR